MTGIISARLIGCAELSDGQPAMLLPIFAEDGYPAVYAQIYNGLGKIVAFCPVDEVVSHTIPDDDTTIVSLGEEPIIAFSKSDGSIVVGRRTDVLTQLRMILGDHKIGETFKLSAYELIGDLERISYHRSKSIDLVTEKFGVQTGLLYKNAMATDLMWQMMSENASDSEARQRLGAFRATSSAKFFGVDIHIDFGLLEPRDFLISAEEMRLRISSEMRGVAAAGDGLAKADLSDTGGTDPAYKDLVRAVGLARRQEERVAILIRSILVSPRQGIHLLENYPYTAKFETEAIALIQNTVGRWENVDEKEMEWRISGCIRPLISRAYPMRKGEVIFYFAAHLSDFEYLKMQIENAYRSSQAISVHLLKKDIEAALNARAR